MSWHAGHAIDDAICRPLIARAFCWATAVLLAACVGVGAWWVSA